MEQPSQYIKNQLNLDDINLVAGVGDPAKNQLCVMSLAAALAGEVHGDEVTCACPVVRSFAIRLNDSLHASDRQKLKAVACEILGTKGSAELEMRRAYRCADWAVREVAAGAIEAAGLVKYAVALRGLPPIVDEKTALVGRDASRKAREAVESAAVCAAQAAFNSVVYAVGYAVDCVDAAADCAADSSDSSAYAAARAASSGAHADSVDYAVDCVDAVSAASKAANDAFDSVGAVNASRSAANAAFDTVVYAVDCAITAASKAAQAAFNSVVDSVDSAAVAADCAAANAAGSVVANAASCAAFHDVYRVGSKLSDRAIAILRELCAMTEVAHV